MPSTITVSWFHRTDVENLKNEVARLRDGHTEDGDQILVESVDACQGKERKVTLTVVPSLAPETLS